MPAEEDCALRLRLLALWLTELDIREDSPAAAACRPPPPAEELGRVVPLTLAGLEADRPDMDRSSWKELSADAAAPGGGGEGAFFLLAVESPDTDRSSWKEPSAEAAVAGGGGALLTAAAEGGAAFAEDRIDPDMEAAGDLVA